MQYFTLQAESHQDATRKMRQQFGESARILTYKSIRLGGLLGLFSREGIEVTGYVSNEAQRKKNVELNNEKRRILETAKREQTLDVLLREVQSMRKALNDRGGPITDDEHPSVTKTRELLHVNAFSREYVEAMVARIRREFTIENLGNVQALQETVVQWIGEQIDVCAPIQFAEEGPKVFILVGPTGVGKTTTIAKIAAIYGIDSDESPPKRVRIITIDNYRIAAREQIRTYGEIMRIPVSFVETAADLRKLIALHQDVDLILIDTIGKNPKDYEKLGEMKSLLEACGTSSETHLAVSATTKTADLEDILRQFEPFDYRSVVLTKLDETTRIGNILSALHKKRKPISYTTDGQAVPQDIEEASVVRLLTNLEGFRINRELVESKFADTPGDPRTDWS